MWYHNLLVQLLLITQFCFAQQQGISTHPNPRTSGYSECGLKSRGYVCDPEKELTEQERYRLNNELLQLSRRTMASERTDFCTTKGADATLFIAKQGNEQLANQLKNHWAIDGQCKKSVIFVLSTNDKHLYYAADENFPISVNNVEKIIDEQEELLSEGKYTLALTTILKKLGQSVQEKSNSSKGMKTQDDTFGRMRMLSMGVSQVTVLSFLSIIASIILHLLIV